MTRDLKLKVLNLAKGGSYETVVLKIMDSVSIHHRQGVKAPLRRPRAIENAPASKEKVRNEEAIRPKEVQPEITQRPKSKYRKEEHRSMGQEIEEHCLMFEFNPRYLHLRKLYETYQQINRSINDWMREKKKYSRYT